MIDETPIERKRVYHRKSGPTRTKQSEAPATDINRIMDKYVKTGKVPGAGEIYSYGDFSGAVDFHTAMNRVRQAEEQFMDLPAHVRKHCDNDPGKFLDLVMDSAGRAELESLGLVSDFAPPGAPEPEPGNSAPQEGPGATPAEEKAEGGQ